MYETKAFWGKEDNPNINTLNTTMNFASAANLIPIIILFVVALGIIMFMSTMRGFG